MVGPEPALEAAPAHLELFEPAPAAAAGGSWLSMNKFNASMANEPSSDKDVTSTSASFTPCLANPRFEQRLAWRLLAGILG